MMNPTGVCRVMHALLCATIVIVVNLFACEVHIVISLKSFPKSIGVNKAWDTHIIYK